MNHYLGSQSPPSTPPEQGNRCSFVDPLLIESLTVSTVPTAYQVWSRQQSRIMSIPTELHRDYNFADLRVGLHIAVS